MEGGVVNHTDTTTGRMPCWLRKRRGEGKEGDEQRPIREVKGRDPW